MRVFKALIITKVILLSQYSLADKVSANAISEGIVAQCIKYVASDSETITCINESFKKAMFETEILKRKLRQDLSALLSLRSHIQIENLDIQDFTPDTVSIRTQFDYEFDSKCFSISKGVGRGLQIASIVDALLESALFIKQYRVFSLGRPASVLFDIKKIQICSREKLGDDFDYEDGTLNVGIVTSGIGRPFATLKNKKISAKQMMDLWNDGVAVHPKNKSTGWWSLLPALGSTTSGEANIQDIISDKWFLLNPVGMIRKNLRLILSDRLHHLLAKINIQNSNFKQRFKNIMRHPGFTEKMRTFVNTRTDEQLNELHSRWFKKLRDPIFLGKAIGGILRQGQKQNSCIGEKNSIDGERTQDGAILNLMNAKNIGVDLSMFGVDGQALDRFLMDPEMKIAEHLQNCGGNVKVKDKQTGAWINLNLIDNVQVNVEWPSQFFSRLAAYAAYEILSEEIEQADFLN